MSPGRGRAAVALGHDTECACLPCRLRRWRLAAGLTQTEAAVILQRAGLLDRANWNSVQRYESGRLARARAATRHAFDVWLTAQSKRQSTRAQRAEAEQLTAADVRARALELLKAAGADGVTVANIAWSIGAQPGSQRAVYRALHALREAGQATVVKGGGPFAPDVWRAA